MDTTTTDEDGITVTNSNSLGASIQNVDTLGESCYCNLVFCLSVCLCMSVCLYMNKISGELTTLGLRSSYQKM